MAKDQRCGHVYRDGATCTRLAGWGTDHVGAGRCYQHGGNTPSSRVKAAKELADQRAATDVRRFSTRRAITWEEALQEELEVTAGRVQWLRERVERLDPESLVWSTTEHQYGMTPAGAIDKTVQRAGPAALYALEMGERRHLAELCRLAAGTELAARYLHLEQGRAQFVLTLFDQALERLGLTAAQRAALSEIMPQVIAELTGTE